MNKNYRLSQSYSGNIGEEGQSPNLQRYHTNGSRYSSIHDNAFNASRRDSLRSMSYQSTIESAELPYEPEATPLPKMQMFVVFLILVSEPLTSTVLFPFIYFMVCRSLDSCFYKTFISYCIRSKISFLLKMKKKLVLMQA